MKISIRRPFFLCALITGVGLMMVDRVTAQVFTSLHSFTTGSGSYGGPWVDTVTNSDGAYPFDGLILSGSTLYGTAAGGGTFGNGTVFRVNTDGTGFTNLYSFSGGRDGANPFGGLILSGKTLYGTASIGSGAGDGTVFRVNTDGTGFTNLHSFDGNDGGPPQSALLLSANTLYGATTDGGNSGTGGGTVFAVNTDGTGYRNLHSFTANYDFDSPNSDGATPAGRLILSGSTLYGTTYEGGASGFGTVFAINTNGTGFSTLHNFTGDGDGVNPQGGLVLSGKTLYGSAGLGPVSSTVFKLNTDGTGFITLHTNDYSPPQQEQAGLILSGNTLYGTTGPDLGAVEGSVFAVNTDGTGFTTLYIFFFGVGSDRGNPSAVMLSGDRLYGTTAYGGTNRFGTVFSISFPPQLTTISSARNLILSWPTNYVGFDYTGFTLQSSTSLGSGAVWNTNLASPVVVNGQFTVTNPISGTQQFFRLSQ